jgi:phage terminase large subunit GpA-like protein
VQKNRLVYVVRGWGGRQESWLIEAGELWGETAHDDVWTDLSELLERRFEGDLMIQRCFIDAGFRPGKRDMVPEHKVYDFCRRHGRQVRASKGFEYRDQPLSVKRVDVNSRGQAAKYGLDLVRLDTDFLKSWVHSRLRWPVDQPGGWHLPNDVTEAYCKQIVSESRVRKAGGGHTWVQRSRENHWLDAEALAYAAAYMLGVQRLSPEAAENILSRRERDNLHVRSSAPGQPGQKPVKAPVRYAKDTWLGAERGNLRGDWDL